MVRLASRVSLMTHGFFLNSIFFYFERRRSFWQHYVML